jgi:hypothetical protein
MRSALQLGRHAIEQFIHTELEKRNFHGTDCAGLIRGVIIDAHTMQKRDGGLRIRAAASPLSTARIRVLFADASSAGDEGSSTDCIVISIDERNELPELAIGVEPGNWRLVPNPQELAQTRL